MKENKRLKITFNSPVILGFVFLSLIALILGFISGGWITDRLFSTYHSSIFNPMTWLRFFTHVLGHAGWEHYIGNMSFILLIGPMLEEKYGSATLLEIICITGLVTGLINYILFPNIMLCGASGVVFAFILMTSFTSFKEGEIPLTFIIVAVIYLGGQVISGIAVRDNISNLSHIIGGVIGAAVGYMLNKKDI